MPGRLSGMLAAGILLAGCGGAPERAAAPPPPPLRALPPSAPLVPPVARRPQPLPADGGILTRARPPSGTLTPPLRQPPLESPLVRGSERPLLTPPAELDRLPPAPPPARFPGPVPAETAFAPFQLAAPADAATGEAEIEVRARLAPQALAPREGATPRTLVIFVQVRNLAAPEVTVTPQRFSLQAAGRICPRALSSSLRQPLGSAALPPGGWIEGALAFEIPEHAAHAVLRFHPARPTQRVRYELPRVGR